MYRLMIVDDEENVLKALRRTLNGFTVADVEGREIRIAVETFHVPQEALERAAFAAFDLVISDYRMPAMNGIEFLKVLKQCQPNIACLLLTGYADLEGIIGAINKVGISRFIPKPWHDYELMEAVSQALSYRAMLLENERLADLLRVQEGQISQQLMALKQLEQEHPGLAKVNWGPGGSVLIDDV